MAARELEEVLADVIDAMHRYPAIRKQVLHCLFDENGLRSGVYDMVTDTIAITKHGGTELSLHTRNILPSTWLLLFASAVSNGVVPEMALPGGA